MNQSKILEAMPISLSEKRNSHVFSYSSLKEGVAYDDLFQSWGARTSKKLGVTLAGGVQIKLGGL